MILFLFLVSLLVLAQHPFWSSYVGDLTAIKYLGAGCLVYAILHALCVRSLPRFWETPQARWFLLLILIVSISYMNDGPVFSWIMNPWISYASFLVLFFVTVTVVDTAERFRWVALVAIGSVAWGGVYVIHEWQTFHTIYPGFRPGWVVGDSNYFAVSAGFTLPLAACLLIHTRPRWEQIFCAGCMLITFVAATLAGSRGGFLGLLAAALFFVCHSRRPVRNTLIIMVLLGPLSMVLPESPGRRLFYPTAADNRAADNRVAMWKAGLRMIADRPLTGVGLGNFKLAAEKYRDPGETALFIAHNTYLEIACETGLPALLAFLILLYHVYRTLGQVLRATSAGTVEFQGALALKAGFLSYMVAAFFVTATYQKLFWFMVFLSMCLQSLISERNEKASERPASQLAAAFSVF